VVDRLQQEFGPLIELQWKAFELRPEPIPLPAADHPARRERWARSILPMAAERGLTMRLPTIATRTRLTFQATEFAREHAKFQGMHTAIFEAFFRDSRDIGDVETLGDLGASIDLDPKSLKAALQRRSYLPRVLEQERLAHDIGVTGVPAMFVGDDLAIAEPVIGAVPYETMKAAVERALSGTSLEWRRRALKSAIPLKER
jgi:predicted DsbA family dithiol-disulfide isomerase